MKSINFHRFGTQTLRYGAISVGILLLLNIAYLLHAGLVQLAYFYGLLCIFFLVLIGHLQFILKRVSEFSKFELFWNIAIILPIIVIAAFFFLQPAHANATLLATNSLTKIVIESIPWFVPMACGAFVIGLVVAVFIRRPDTKKLS